MANILQLMMKTAMPVSLMKLLAIPLDCQKTAAKWLVISRKRGGRSEGGVAGQTNGYASFMLAK